MFLKLKLNNISLPFRDFRDRNARGKKILSANSIRCLNTLFLMFAVANSGESFAQSAGDDFVDAFAQVDASASDFHSARFNAAEQALLEGLSKRVGEKTDRGDKAALHHVSATKRELDSARGIGSNGVVSQDVALRGIDRTSPDNSYRSNLSGSGDRLDALPRFDEGSVGEKKRDLENKKAALASRVKKATVDGRAAKAGPSEQAKNNSANSVKAKVDQQASLAVTDKREAMLGARVTQEDKNEDPRQELLALKRELAEARGALAAAELEISRLSTVMQGQSKARLNISSTAPSNTINKASAPPKVAQPARAAVAPQPVPPPPTQDLQVATISVEKAELRLGPGLNNSALMTLSRGSRLAVEARQGDWYRVFAPNGQRAWIHSSLVRFGEGAASLNDGSSVNVMGFNSNVQ
jgi:hypothetical protein